MTFRMIGAFTACLALAGCSNGLSLNPNDWFGPKEDIELVTLEPQEGWGAQDVDYRSPIQQITELRLERASGGYLIRATGIPPRLGYWEAELVPENDERAVDGTLTYTFVVAPPVFRQPNSQPSARAITVAHFVSDAKLANAGRVQVVSETNVLTARR